VKRWTGEADTVGESIGFFKVAHDDLPGLIDIVLSMSSGAARAASYDEVLRQMVGPGGSGTKMSPVCRGSKSIFRPTSSAPRARCCPR
jgi:hypothetical protein